MSALPHPTLEPLQRQPGLCVGAGLQPVHRADRGHRRGVAQLGGLRVPLPCLQTRIRHSNGRQAPISRRRARTHSTHTAHTAQRWGDSKRPISTRSAPDRHPIGTRSAPDRHTGTAHTAHQQMASTNQHPIGMVSKRQSADDEHAHTSTDGNHQSAADENTSTNKSIVQGACGSAEQSARNGPN